MFAYEHPEHKISKRVAEPKQELSELRQGHSGARFIDNVHEFSDMLRKRRRISTHHFADQISVMRDRAKDNPKTTVALVTGVSLLAGLLSTWRKQSRLWPENKKPLFNNRMAAFYIKSNLISLFPDDLYIIKDRTVTVLHPDLKYSYHSAN